VKNEILSASKITASLPGRHKTLSVAAYETIDSTNRVAKEMSAANPLPLLVVADGQTAGRGRLGRSFYSPTSTGIYMSLAVGGFDSPQSSLFLTTAAAVAVTDAIISLTGKNAGIKWVNDIYLDGKKIGGILAEAKDLSNQTAIILGIGINMTTSGFPDEISESAGSLKSDVPHEEMIAEICKNLLDYCDLKNKDSIIDSYKQRSILLGKEINYFAGGVKTPAVAVDIDKNGGLVVRHEDGTFSTLSSGEVTVRLE